jgi:glutathione S-transferase
VDAIVHPLPSERLHRQGVQASDRSHAAVHDRGAVARTLIKRPCSGPMLRRMLRFYAESFAPWCEKARWALDHHGIAYREIEHVPLVGDVALRIAARRPVGRVTVPLLVSDGEVLMDSLAIARFTERAGSGTPLFSSAGVEDWNARSETLMVAGRAMLLPRIAASDDALREQLPEPLPRGWTGIARLGVRHLVRKYEVRSGDHEARARGVLDTLRGALGNGRHLVGDALSFADIAMATALQFVLPVDNRYIALGPATRRAWTHEALAEDYGDLLAWRDGLYATSR